MKVYNFRFGVRPASPKTPEQARDYIAAQISLHFRSVEILRSEVRQQANPHSMLIFKLRMRPATVACLRNWFRFDEAVFEPRPERLQ